MNEQSEALKEALKNYPNPRSKLHLGQLLKHGYRPAEIREIYVSLGRKSLYLTPEQFEFYSQQKEVA